MGRFGILWMSPFALCYPGPGSYALILLCSSNIHCNGYLIDVEDSVLQIGSTSLHAVLYDPLSCDIGDHRDYRGL